MSKFSDLPYEVRILILETNRKQSFHEKINRFEKIFISPPKPENLPDNCFYIKFPIHSYLISNHMVIYYPW